MGSEPSRKAMLEFHRYLITNIHPKISEKDKDEAIEKAKQNERKSLKLAH